MADQYQPYYDDSAIRAVPHVSLFPQSESEIPYGTTFSLFDHTSYDHTVFVDNAVMVSLSPDSGRLLVWFNGGRTPNVGITTTSFRAAAHYPDGSSEIFKVTLNLIPEDTHAYDAAYDDTYIRIGSRAEVVPFIRNHYGAQFPDGTSFSLTGYYEVDDRRAEGWIIELDRVSGVLTIEIPESAAESSVEVPVVVTYPDGSKDNISTTVFAEGPDDAELYATSFEMVTVQAGTTGTTDSLAAGLPSDTGFYLSDLGPLSSFFDAGGSISISWDGSFIIDIPAIWTEDLAIPLFVLFPDGSSTTSNLEIDVIPADQNEIFDVQFEHYPLQAGTTETIYATTDAQLPPGTSIEMVDDENIDVLRAAGWEFNVIDDLNISVTVPTDAIDGVNVNVKVAYPDGTSEIAPVNVLVNPLLAALYDVEYSEAVLNAGDSIYVTPNDAWGGWSYYASTSIDESPELAVLQDEGWSIEGNGYTGLYITAPQTATTSITLPLTIHYYDGSTEESQVRITVIPEKQAVLHDVTYPATTITAGDTTTITPDTPDLPAGTMILLGYDQALIDAEDSGWSIENYQNGEITVTAPITAIEGTTLTVQIIYPDNTTEYTTVDIAVTPANHADNHDVTYPPASIDAGGTITLTPGTRGIPEGTTITIIENEALDTAHNAGWIITSNTNGELTASVPVTATDNIQVDFDVLYPDGTTEITTAIIDVNPANHADNHDVTYPTITISAGDTTTIAPDTTALPAGTTITLISNTGIDEGWSITADNDGVLNITAPITATNSIFADFLVAYPDGTTEETTATIDVNPANHADNHDVTYPTITISAGDTTTIAPDTTALPAGTTITLIEDNNLEAAGITGWHFLVTADGKVTVSTLESSVGRAVINLLVTYPDGTSEVTAVDISALAKPIIEDPISPAPAPRPGGSSFGSS